MPESQGRLQVSIEIPQRRRRFSKPFSVNVSIPIPSRRTRFAPTRLIRNYIIRSQLSRIGVRRNIRASVY